MKVVFSRRYKLVKKHTGTYNVEIDRGEAAGCVGLVIALAGAVPFFIGCFVTCCALPRFLFSVCQQTALKDPEVHPGESEDLPPKEQGTSEAKEVAQVYFSEAWETVPKLKESSLSGILDHDVTRYSLISFFVIYTAANAANYIDIVSADTYPSLPQG